jgi:hypothetical protein
VYRPKGKLTGEARRLMLNDMKHVHELVGEQKYDEALKLTENVFAGLNWAGVQSVHVRWALAVINDYRGEGEAAFKHIMEAARMDPLDPTVVRSFDIITDKLRRSLLDPSRDLADESTPRLHAMLVEAGKADELVHVAMARHLAETGRGEQAMKLLDAVTTLTPDCRDAWVVKAMLASKLGMAELAATAEQVARACEFTNAPVFGAPGPAEA